MAVCLALEGLGIEPAIVTNSRYAAALGRLTGLRVHHIQSSDWVGGAPSLALSIKPRLVVTDTFPWGIRGEWADLAESALRFVYIARRLRVQSYLEAAGLRWEPAGPLLRRAILIEPLSEFHQRLLEASCRDLHVLGGPIRFPSESFPVTSPEFVLRAMERCRVWLIVHSGPAKEVSHLLGRAESEAAGQGDNVMVAIGPRPFADLNCHSIECLPASGLYEGAYRVVTGAGYNAMAEMGRRPEKHISVPFVRRYDDQHGRLRERFFGNEPSGASEAARVLCGML
ncbi:hypothetical protein ACFL2Q_18270 [Thermodesulfobacteriota bacterium]